MVSGIIGAQRSDAVAAMGGLPTARISLHGLLLHVTDETLTGDVDLPSHATETGIELSDHVGKKAKVITLKGWLSADSKHSIEDKLKLIEHYRDRGTEMTYNGRNVAHNMAILRFNHTAGEYVDTLDFTMTLTEIRKAKKVGVTKSPTAKTTSNTGMQTTEKKGTTTKEQYHVVKRGETYITIAKKYNVDWKQVKKWAGYPDTRIPVGVKVRVK